MNINTHTKEEKDEFGWIQNSFLVPMAGSQLFNVTPHKSYSGLNTGNGATNSINTLIHTQRSLVTDL